MEGTRHGSSPTRPWTPSRKRAVVRDLPPFLDRSHESGSTDEFFGKLSSLVFVLNKYEICVKIWYVYSEQTGSETPS